MLDHQGFSQAAQRLEAAVDHVYAEGRVLTPEQGGRGTTASFTDEVISACPAGVS